MLRINQATNFVAALLLAAAALQSQAQEPLESIAAPPATPPQQQTAPAAKPAQQPTANQCVQCGSCCVGAPCCYHCPVLGDCAHCPVLGHPWAYRCRDIFPIRKHVQKGPPPYAVLPPKPPTFLPVPAAPVYTPMQAQSSHLIPTVIPTAPGSYLHLPVGY